MCVADVIANGAWLWPQSWLRKAPNLAFIPVPMLIDKEDCMRWRDAHWNMVMFSVKCAWEALRPRGIEVSWYSIAWFSQAIPRHAFHMWLIMRRSLKKQDKNAGTWDLFVQGTKHSFNSIVGKLLFGAAAYYIWIERNNRLFKKSRRSPEEIRDLVVVTVRLKLVKLRFKNNPTTGNIVALPIADLGSSSLGLEVNMVL
ncbi:reverse transcriptase domain, reverse transcriptase zinc-binding domain protein [Tanacetum coccineum]